MKIALFLAALGVPAFAFGQVSPDRVDPTVVQPPTAQGATAKRGGIRPPQDRVSEAFSLGGSYTAPADYGDSGVVSIYRAGAELTVHIPAIPDELAVTVGLTEEWSWYDFHDFGPVNQVALARVSPGVFWTVDDRWALVGGLSLEAAGEKDAGLSDSLTYGGFAGARYKVSPTLSFTGGVAGRSELEDDASIFPLLGVDWDFAPDWNFSVRGPGAKVTWSATEEWDFSIQGSFESRAYRLDDHLGLRDEGVFRDRRAVVGLQAQWTPAVWFSLRGEVGAVVWSELKLDDDDGDRVNKEHGDPTGYAGLSATFRF